MSRPRPPDPPLWTAGASGAAIAAVTPSKGAPPLPPWPEPVPSPFGSPVLNLGQALIQWGQAAPRGDI